LSDIRQKYPHTFFKSLDPLQHNKSSHGYDYIGYRGYQKNQYIRPYEKIRFDDAPDPIYGFTVRTRQVFPCEGKAGEDCADLEENGQVVECQQNRFRLVQGLIKSNFILV
jgi:hypothetical protein